MSAKRIDTSLLMEAAAEGLTIYSSDTAASFSVFSVINSSEEVFNIYSDGSVYADELLVSGGITIGSKTNGDYVASIVDSTGVTLTGTLNATLAIGQPVGTSDSPTFLNVETTQGVTVTGEVDVTGLLTIINSGTVSFADNIIVINSNAPSTPTEDAGIEIERGSLANVLLKWDETLEKWRLTNDGSNYFDLPEEKNLDDLSDVSISSPLPGEALYYDGSSWINEDLVTPSALTGSILAYVSSTPPSGWLICDGSQISQTTYADLYTEIGSTYNDGSESVGNFRLPDYRNALAYGVETTAGQNSLSTGNRSTAHSHTTTLLNENNPHSHPPFTTTGAITAHTHPITSAPAGDPAHNHPNPVGDSLNAVSSADASHTHPVTFSSGELANHNHNAPNGPSNSAGTGGTHPARHNPPNTLRSSGAASAGHTHPAGGANCSNASANHSHTGITPFGSVANHSHPITINPSNTGTHTINFAPTTHSHNFSVSPDEANSHTHPATASTEVETHIHDVVGVPVYFIIKT
jgi:microcystin-dependent protein